MALDQSYKDNKIYSYPVLLYLAEKCPAAEVPLRFIDAPHRPLTAADGKPPQPDTPPPKYTSLPMKVRGLGYTKAIKNRPAGHCRRGSVFYEYAVSGYFRLSTRANQSSAVLMSAFDQHEPNQ